MKQLKIIYFEAVFWSLSRLIMQYYLINQIYTSSTALHNAIPTDKIVLQFFSDLHGAIIKWFDDLRIFKFDSYAR